MLNQVLYKPLMIVLEKLLVFCMLHCSLVVLIHSNQPLRDKVGFKLVWFVKEVW